MTIFYRAIVIGMTTRTYARTVARYDRELIDMMVEDGTATEMNGVYIIKTEEGTSYIIRPWQIIEPAEKAAMMPALVTPDVDDNQAEADLADQDNAEVVAARAKGGFDGPFQHYLAEARRNGMSLGEYTDGEYYLNDKGEVRPSEEMYNASAFRYQFADRYVDAQVAAGDRRLDRIPGARRAAVEAIVDQLDDDVDDSAFLKLQREMVDMERLVVERERQLDNAAYESAVAPAGTQFDRMDALVNKFMGGLPKATS